MCACVAHASAPIWSFDRNVCAIWNYVYVDVYFLFDRCTRRQKPNVVSFFPAQPVLAGNATQDQLRAFHKVRDDFRSDASKDALYLVVVGIGAFVSTYVFMLIVRIYCVISHCHHGL